MRPDPVVEMVATLFKLGRTPEEISRRVNKPIGWVNQVINDNEVQDHIEKMEMPAYDDGAEIWSEERTAIEVEKLTPVAFRTLAVAMQDEGASVASRIKAAELLLKYQPKLKENTKVDEEKVTHVYISSEQMEILQRLEREFGGFNPKMD